MANPNLITTADLLWAIGNWISITRSYYHHVANWISTSAEFFHHVAVISFLSNLTGTTSFLVTHIGHEKGEICVVHCSISPICLEGCLETEWQGNHANQASHQTGLLLLWVVSLALTWTQVQAKKRWHFCLGESGILHNLRGYTYAKGDGIVWRGSGSYLGWKKSFL